MTTFEERKANKQKFKELIDLKTQLDNIEREGIYPEFKPVIQEKINKLLKDGAMQDAYSFANMSEMTDLEIRELLDNQAKIREEMEKAREEGALSEIGVTESSKANLQKIKDILERKETGIRESERSSDYGYWDDVSPTESARVVEGLLG